MTFRGHVRNGAVVLDAPTELPEGAAVEVNVVESVAHQPASSIEELREPAAIDAGDPFGQAFEESVRNWRNEPWRSSSGERPE
jgi:hypothetical protein